MITGLIFTIDKRGETHTLGVGTELERGTY